ncbi:PTS ascorbate transporter subunit IIC [Anaerorhabdus sp.]|uniref:PTS ascorbate transporter subunit IIC n=1 Tax=Anaerorhabdus sp. TaxID=1872524 RepID=UPI002FC8BDEF
MADKKDGKKPILLRLSPTLWEEINKWAEDDFRSINGQIEYILTDAVKRKKKTKKSEE